MEEHIGRLAGLFSFARAGSLGSFTAAARAMGVSPSAVSKSVQRLEERLGLSLFTRTTRSLVLTPEGRALHERALRLLGEAEAIEQAAIASRAAPSGVLRVTAPTTLGVHVIAPALPRLRRRHPKLSVDLRLSDHLVDVVGESVDVAVRVGELVDSSLASRRLGVHRIAAFAAPSYLKKRGVPKRLEDLGAHDCVTYRYQSSGQALRWPFAKGKGVVEVTPKAWVVADLSDAVLAILVAGGGIGISPTYVAAASVARGELVPVLSKLAVERWPITALWAASRSASPNVKAFVAFLVQSFPTPAPWDACLLGA